MIQFHTMVHSCFAFETENNIYNPLKQSDAEAEENTSDAEAEENIDHNINLHLIGNILQFSWRYRFSNFNCFLFFPRVFISLFMHARRTLSGQVTNRL